MKHTPVKQSNDWLYPILNHAGNKIIIMLHALLIDRPITEWEESRPITVSTNGHYLPLDFTVEMAPYQEKDGEKYGTPKLASLAKSCL